MFLLPIFGVGENLTTRTKRMLKSLQDSLISSAHKSHSTQGHGRAAPRVQRGARTHTRPLSNKGPLVRRVREQLTLYSFKKRVEAKLQYVLL